MDRRPASCCVRVSATAATVTAGGITVGGASAAEAAAAAAAAVTGTAAIVAEEVTFLPKIAALKVCQCRRGLV